MFLVNTNCCKSITIILKEGQVRFGKEYSCFIQKKTKYDKICIENNDKCNKTDNNYWLICKQMIGYQRRGLQKQQKKRIKIHLQI